MTQMVKQTTYDRDAFKLLFHDGFPGGSDGKASAYNAGDPGSIPGSGRSPGGGNGNEEIIFMIQVRPLLIQIK